MAGRVLFGLLVIFFLFSGGGILVSILNGECNDGPAGCTTGAALGAILVHCGLEFFCRGVIGLARPQSLFAGQLGRIRLVSALILLSILLLIGAKYTGF